MKKFFSFFNKKQRTSEVVEVSWVGKSKFAVPALALAIFAAVGVGSGHSHAAAVSFTGTTLPFTVPDMLGTAINFLTMYGEWVLLALGVLFAPVLYSLAMKLVGAVRSKMAKA